MILNCLLKFEVKLVSYADLFFANLYYLMNWYIKLNIILYKNF